MQRSIGALVSRVITSPHYAGGAELAAPKQFGRLWPFLRVSFNGLIVAQIFYIASSVAAIDFFQEFGDEAMPAAMRSAEAFVNMHQAGASLIAAAFTLAAFAAYGRFYYRAMRNLHLSAAKGVDATPLATVSSYAIPVVNLWRPYAIVRQIWRASHDPASSSGAAPVLIGWWWAATLAAALFGAGSLIAALNAGFYGAGITDRALYLDSLMLHIIASVAAIVAAALIIEVSDGVRRAQHAKVLPAGQRLIYGQ